jgi:transposase
MRYPDSLSVRAQPLPNGANRILPLLWSNLGFLDPASRRDLIELTRDGSVPHRLARRANALVFLDQGMSCGDVASVLFLDDDTIAPGIGFIGKTAPMVRQASATTAAPARLSETQQDQLKAWITETLPRTTGAVGAWVEKEFAITYESRSSLVALLHRLGEAGPRLQRRSRWNGPTPYRRQSLAL